MQTRKAKRKIIIISAMIGCFVIVNLISLLNYYAITNQLTPIEKAKYALKGTSQPKMNTGSKSFKLLQPRAEQALGGKYGEILQTRKGLKASYNMDSLDLQGMEQTIDLEGKSLNSFESKEDYALSRITLASLYARQSKSNDQESLNKAIRTFSEALNIYTENKHPVEYAYTCASIGIVYRKLSKLDNKQALSYIENSIEYLNKAQRIFTKERCPIENAQIMADLGSSYYLLSKERDREKNLITASKLISRGLEKLNIESNPIDYAIAQSDLGLACADLVDTRKDKLHIKKSITCFEEALKVYNENQYAQDFLINTIDLAAAYRDLAYFENGRENLVKAIELSERAVKLSTEISDTRKRCYSQYTLASCYLFLSGKENQRDNLFKSIESAEAALQYFTLKEHPSHYKELQLKRGEAAISIATYFENSDTEKHIQYNSLAKGIFKDLIEITSRSKETAEYEEYLLNYGFACALLSDHVDNMQNLTEAESSLREALAYYKDRDAKIYKVFSGYYQQVVANKSNW